MVENRSIVAGIPQGGENSEALRLERFVIAVVVMVEVMRCEGGGRRVGEISAGEEYIVLPKLVAGVGVSGGSR